MPTKMVTGSPVAETDRLLVARGRFPSLGIFRTGLGARTVLHPRFPRWLLHRISSPLRSRGGKERQGGHPLSGDPLS